MLSDKEHWGKSPTSAYTEVLVRGSWGAKHVYLGTPLVRKPQTHSPKSLATSLWQSLFPHPRPFLAARVFLEPHSWWKGGICTLVEWPKTQTIFLSCKTPDVARNRTDREFPFPHATDRPQGCSTVPPFSVLAEAELRQWQLHPSRATSWEAGTSLRDKFNLEKQPAEWHADQRGIAELN